MTAKQLDKLDGHRVFIQKHKFSHSVEMETFTGELIASRGKHGGYSKGAIKEFEHIDFYIDDEKTDKLVCIPWNEVKLITFVQDLGKA